MVRNSQKTAQAFRRVQVIAGFTTEIDGIQHGGIWVWVNTYRYHF